MHHQLPLPVAMYMPVNRIKRKRRRKKEKWEKVPHSEEAVKITLM